MIEQRMTSHERAIALVEQALAIIDEHELDGIAGSYLSHGLAILTERSRAAGTRQASESEARA